MRDIWAFLLQTLTASGAAALLRPLGILLLIWHGADWVFSWFGGTLDGHFDIISLIISLAGLYFHFQLFTDFAALAAKFSSQRTALTAACFGGEPSRRCC